MSFNVKSNTINARMIAVSWRPNSRPIRRGGQRD